MSDTELKLRCIELVSIGRELLDPEELIAMAARLYAFIKGN